MLVYKKNSKYETKVLPIKNCNYYYTLRLTRSKEKTTNDVDVFPCCYAADHQKPLYTFTYNEIMSSNNIYDKLMNIYYSTTNYPIVDVCKEYANTLDINVCNFNNNKLLIVDLSFLHNCNIQCSMCTILNDDDKKTVEMYFKILNDLKQHNISISLTQQGEPFYYKKEIMAFLQALKPNDFVNIVFISNLTMLNDTDINMIHDIMSNTNINFIGLASIDGITEETYKKIRRNNLFNKVIHNAKLLIEYKILRTVNFVAQDMNIHELLEAYDLWHNCYNINFNVLVINDPYDDPGHHYRIKNSEIYKRFLKIKGN